MCSAGLPHKFSNTKYKFFLLSLIHKRKFHKMMFEPDTFLFAHNCGTVRGKSTLQEGASVARSHFRLGVGGDVGVWIEVEVRGIGLRSVLKQQVRTRNSFCSCKLLPFQL